MATCFFNTFLTDMTVAANFDAWFGMIDNQLQNLGGWSYVPTLGDTVFASASSPALNVFNYYRVYSTAVGTSTWYMRLGPGRSNSNAPAMTLILGTVCDASGNLSGRTTNPLTASLTNNLNAAGTTGSLWMSVAQGRLTLIVGSNLTTRGNAWCIGVHATVDATGSLSPNGIEYYYAENQHNANQNISVSGSYPTVANAFWPLNNLSSNLTNDAGTTVAFTFPQTWTDAGPNNPCPVVCGVGASDVATNYTTFLTVYGQSRRYLITPESDQGGSGNVVCCYLFD